MDSADLYSLCQHFALGKMIAPLTPISTRHQHRVWKLDTDAGQFALKALDPKLMQAPEVYRQTEAYAAALQTLGLPSLSALAPQLLELHERYYLVYPWLEGEVLKRDALLAHHAQFIGRCLQRLHHTQTPVTLTAQTESALPPAQLWQNYCEYLKPSPLREALGMCLQLMRDLSAAYRMVAPQLTAHLVLSHRDLTPENVIWQSERPIIIDWELAGPIHRGVDLLATALNWSLDPNAEIRYEHLKAFINGYAEAVPGSPQALIVAVLAEWMRWIHLNVERVMDPFLAEAQRHDAAANARYSLLALRNVYRERDSLIGLLKA